MAHGHYTLSAFFPPGLLFPIPTFKLSSRIELSGGDGEGGEQELCLSAPNAVWRSNVMANQEHITITPEEMGEEKKRLRIQVAGWTERPELDTETQRGIIGLVNLSITLKTGGIYLFNVAAYFQKQTCQVWANKITKKIRWQYRHTRGCCDSWIKRVYRCIWLTCASNKGGPSHKLGVHVCILHRHRLCNWKFCIDGGYKKWGIQRRLNHWPLVQRTRLFFFFNWEKWCEVTLSWFQTREKFWKNFIPVYCEWKKQICLSEKKSQPLLLHLELTMAGKIQISENWWFNPSPGNTASISTISRRDELIILIQLTPKSTSKGEGELRWGRQATFTKETEWRSVWTFWVG